MSKRRKIFIGLVILTGMPVAWLVTEHFRGKWALAAWEKAARAQGEKLDLSELLPSTPAPAQDGTEQFMRAATLLDKSPQPVYVFSVIAAAPGKAVSFLSRDDFAGLLTNPEDPPATNANWKAVTAMTATNAPHLAMLQTALQAGHLRLLKTYATPFESGFEDMGKKRNATRWLGLSALAELREGRRDLAARALVDIARLARQQEHELFTINQLVRIAGAIEGMNAAWQALQVSEWTDAELNVLQRAWEGWTFSEAVPTTIRTERAAWRAEFEKCRQNPPRLLEIKSILLLPDNPAERGWLGQMVGPMLDHLREKARPAVYAPLWSFAWSHQDERQTMEQFDRILAYTDKAATNKSLPAGNLLYAHDRPEFAIDVPAPDAGYRLIISSHVEGRSFFRFCLQAMRADTRKELLMTAIALKRHHLRHGRYPATLQELVPGLMPALPRDFMDGQPLRYRSKEDGTFLLYSVGEDGKDDGGNATKVDRYSQTRDLVWLWPATEGEIAAYLAERKAEKK